METKEVESYIKSRGTQYCLLAGKILMIYDKNDRLEKSIKLEPAQLQELKQKYPFIAK